MTRPVGRAGRRRSHRRNGPMLNSTERAIRPAYRVRYLSIHGGKRDLVVPIIVATLNVTIYVAFVAWLFDSGHIQTGKPGFAAAAEIFVLCTIAIMEVFRLVQVLSLSLASVLACDPVPPPPAPELRVAFVTTIVPNREPLSMVRRTLAAARQIRCANLDVWLLDEGDDPAVRRACAALGVLHFSRSGKARYNTGKGMFGARTKHGNLNSWLAVHQADYDVMLCVDPDHMPVPEFAERVLGYFNDPNVAYVVGPQCYGNVGEFVSRAAESQQFPFHSIIQRAGNRYRAPMLVGTNNAIRVSSLVQAGGFADSITEDMATGLLIKSSRNPSTRRRWEAVYVPDILAVGEGPSCWNDYFTQQLRWSRGSFQVIGRTFARRACKLSPRALLHYLMIISFYPSMAVGWLLGAANSLLFVAVQARGISVPVQIWTILYADALVFQLWVYVRSRRHNVSPFDRSSAGGFIGMAMTVMTAPMYAGAFVNALLFRRGRFVVTPKGESATGDSWRTFRRYIAWAAFYLALVGYATVINRAPVTVLLWPGLSVLIALSPVVLWRLELRTKAAGRVAERELDPARHTLFEPPPLVGSRLLVEGAAAEAV